MTKDEFDAIETKTEQVKIVMAAGFSTVSFTNILIGGSLKFIWSMINLL